MSSTSRAVDLAAMPHARPCWCAECKQAYGRAYYRLNSDRWVGYELVRRYHDKATPITYAECAASDCTRCWVVSPRSRQRKWCSDRCLQRQRYRDSVAHLKGIERQCIWCFGTYVNRQQRVKHCSDKCRRAARAHWTLHHHPNVCHLPLCRDCGQLTGKALNHPRCVECVKLSKNSSSPATNARKNARRREAVANGESFSIEDLIGRDGLGCACCGVETSPHLPSTHPLKATIDHVVPLSLGGEHTMANCQVMCRSCNCRKGNRMLTPEQLRLV